MYFSIKFFTIYIWRNQCCYFLECDINLVLLHCKSLVLKYITKVGSVAVLIFKQKKTHISEDGLPKWPSWPLTNVGDVRNTGSIPVSWRSLGEGHDNPLQYCCLENPVDRGTWQAAVDRVAKSWTRLRWLSMHILILEGT